MRGAFGALVRRQLLDSRWLIGLSAAALFGLSWLMVFGISRFETRVLKSETRVLKDETDTMSEMRRQGFARGMRVIGGDAVDGTSGSLELALWVHPLFVIPLLIALPITRGSGAVAGELDRGRLDMVLSRPVTRTQYLASHVFVTVIGLAALALALMAGNIVAHRFHPVETPPSLIALARAGFMVVVLGFSIYGYSLGFSSIFSSWWAPLLISFGITFGGGIAIGVKNIFENIPSLSDWLWIDNLSVFKLYDPVDAALRMRDLAFNAGVLGGLGLAGVVFAFVIFQYRDLPTSA